MSWIHELISGFLNSVTRVLGLKQGISVFKVEAMLKSENKINVGDRKKREWTLLVLCDAHAFITWHFSDCNLYIS